MSGKVVFIISFLIFWGILFLTGNWYPELNLPLNLDPIQNGAIRGLASFTYVGDSLAQNRILLILTVEFGCISLIWGWKNPKQLLDMTKYFTFVLGFIWFFYWRFLSRYAEELYLIYKLNLFLAMFFQMGIIFGFGIITFVIGNLIQKRLESNLNANQTIPSTEFECPDCHTKCTSNVQYCLNCKKEIN